MYLIAYHMPVDKNHHMAFDAGHLRRYIQNSAGFAVASIGGRLAGKATDFVAGGVHFLETSHDRFRT